MRGIYQILLLHDRHNILRVGAYLYVLIGPGNSSRSPNPCSSRSSRHLGSSSMCGHFKITKGVQSLLSKEYRRNGLCERWMDEWRDLGHLALARSRWPPPVAPPSWDDHATMTTNCALVAYSPPRHFATEKKQRKGRKGA